MEVALEKVNCCTPAGVVIEVSGGGFKVTECGSIPTVIVVLAGMPGPFNVIPLVKSVGGCQLAVDGS
jgi:hypothetical protein